MRINQALAGWLPPDLVEGTYATFKMAILYIIAKNLSTLDNGDKI